MCVTPLEIEQNSETIEPESQPEQINAPILQPWYLLVPFAEAYHEFQNHTIHHLISFTPTGRPLLAVIWYNFEIIQNQGIVYLAIDIGHRILRVTSTTLL